MYDDNCLTILFDIMTNMSYRDSKKYLQDSKLEISM